MLEHGADAVISVETQTSENSSSSRTIEHLGESERCDLPIPERDWSIAGSNILLMVQLVKMASPAALGQSKYGIDQGKTMIMVGKAGDWKRDIGPEMSGR